ncbi:MAG: MMPL family transporter [Kineosporiaceae bacterium]
MATFLYRLGRASYRRRGRVLAAWALIVALAGLGAATLAGTTSNTFTIPGAESQKALDLLGERMPQAAADDATARVVFTTTTGTLTDAGPKATIAAAVTELAALPRVVAAVDPFTLKTVSPDGRTAYAQVTYEVRPSDITPADHDRLLAVAERARAQGLGVEVGGSAMQEQPGASVAEVIGIAVAAVVLVITFGALVAAGLPLVTAIVGVTLGVLGIRIGTGFFELSSSVPTLALMLGLAVAIDYALFIVSRYRHELLQGRDGEEAAGRALGTAGSAVVFAGLTVVIALAALAVVRIPFLTAMGLAAAGTVAGAVVIALTLLPALLGFAGERVLGRRGRSARDTEADVVGGKAPAGERWARGVLRHRVVVLLVSVAALATLALPASSLRLGLPSDGNLSPDTTQRKAYDQLSAAFGPGFNGPLLVAVDTAGSSDAKGEIAGVESALQGLPGVVAVTPATPNAAGDLAILTVVPGTGPSTTETEDLVGTLRDRLASATQGSGARAYVTGETALQIDVSEQLSKALLPYLAVVVGLAFVLLVLVFRSILVPLKATLGFLLSVAAAFGAVVAVFQKGWLAGAFGVDATGPIVSFLPIFLIGVLFGLAMDYEVFLVTRMREEHVHGASADDAITLGFRHGARVVTAAAVIMASVFAGFVTAPEPIIKSMGFALAFGVLVDAFVVRMTLVPAVMSLLGDRAWWLPRWLERVMPDVDVEGASLGRHLETSSSAGDDPVAGSDPVAAALSGGAPRGASPAS